MKTRTARVTKRRKSAARSSGAPEGPRGRSGAVSTIVAVALVAVVGAGAYRAGEALSSKALPPTGIVISVSQSGVEGITKVGKERAKVKGASGSVFSEGDVPTVVGDIPAGWRVETSPDIKAKFGPQPVPGSEDITFVVPVYTLVPEERRPGAYVMEPGLSEDGQDGGGTLRGVLGRMESEAGAISSALTTLTDSLSGLERLAPESLEADPVEGAGEVDQ